MQDRKDENSQQLPPEVLKQLNSVIEGIERRLRLFPIAKTPEEIVKQKQQAIFQEKRSRENLSDMFFNIIEDPYIKYDERVRQIKQLISIVDGVSAVNPPGELPDLAQFKKTYPNVSVASFLSCVYEERVFPNLIDIRNIAGSTPLMMAAAKGQTEIVHCLLEAKADVNAKNKKRQTTLMAGAAYDDIVSLLLESKADPNDVNETKITALHLIKGSPESAKLLIDAKADVNAKDHKGYTPLMYAINSPNPKAGQCMKVLLKAGADPKHKSLDGMSPFKLELFWRAEGHRMRVEETKSTHKLTK